MSNGIQEDFKKTGQGSKSTFGDLFSDFAGFVRYKDRQSDPGKCRVLAINFERRELEVTNGAVRLWPSFDEVIRCGEEVPLAEAFTDMKEESKLKRAGNRMNSAKMLKEACIPFDVKNGGAHLLVEGDSHFIDFWPGTGRWRCRSGKKGGFGVRNLIKYCS